MRAGRRFRASLRRGNGNFAAAAERPGARKRVYPLPSLELDQMRRLATRHRTLLVARLRRRAPRSPSPSAPAIGFAPAGVDHPGAAPGRSIPDRRAARGDRPGQADRPRPVPGYLSGPAPAEPPATPDQPGGHRRDRRRRSGGRPPRRTDGPDRRPAARLPDRPPPVRRSTASSARSSATRPTRSSASRAPCIAPPGTPEAFGQFWAKDPGHRVVARGGAGPGDAVRHRPARRAPDRAGARTPAVRRRSRRWPLEVPMATVRRRVAGLTAGPLRRHRGRRPRGRADGVRSGQRADSLDRRQRHAIRRRRAAALPGRARSLLRRSVERRLRLRAAPKWRNGRRDGLKHR